MTGTLPAVARMTCVVLIPVYNDWTALQRLLTELDAALGPPLTASSVLIVDDGSRESAEAELRRLVLRNIAGLTILRLRRNLGHQRAIAIGLCHLHAHSTSDLVVVMDGDGEDRPGDVPTLLAAARAASSPQILFAARARRSDGVVFLLLYHAYKILHRILTGIQVRVGNFSVIPRPVLTRLVGVSDLWNHYAAAVFKSRLPYAMVPLPRGRRYAGRSQMDFVALVTHGLSAMAAFGDRIGVRLLAATLGMAGVMAVVVVVLLALHFVEGFDVPGWAPLAAALTAMLLFQTIAISFAFVFIILAGRESSTFVPLRDYAHYILDVTVLTAPADE